MFRWLGRMTWTKLRRGAHRRPCSTGVPPPAFPERVPRPPAHTGRWLAASAVAALLLAGQAPAPLPRHAGGRPGLRPGGARRSTRASAWPLYPAWPLEAYEIRDSKAIAEKSAPGALDIVAEIAVTGRQPVGLPMVRVVLRDRWSNPVASGVFEPAHYLAEAAGQSKRLRTRLVDSRRDQPEGSRFCGAGLRTRRLHPQSQARPAMQDPRAIRSDIERCQVLAAQTRSREIFTDGRGHVRRSLFARSCLRVHALVSETQTPV